MAEWPRLNVDQTTKRASATSLAKERGIRTIQLMNLNMSHLYCMFSWFTLKICKSSFAWYLLLHFSWNLVKIAIFGQSLKKLSTSLLKKTLFFLFLEKLKRLHTTSSLLITFRRVKGTYLSSLLNLFYCNSEPTRTITDAKDSLEHPNNFGLKSDYPTVERE